MQEWCTKNMHAYTVDPALTQADGYVLKISSLEHICMVQKLTRLCEETYGSN
jgi:hypothetical protein